MKRPFGSKPIEYPEFDDNDPVIGEVLKRPPEDGVVEKYRFSAAEAIRDEPYWMLQERFKTKFFPHEFMQCTCPYCGPTFILNYSVQTSNTFADTRLRMACGCEWKHQGLITCDGPHGWTRVGDSEEIPYQRGRRVFVRESEDLTPYMGPAKRPVAVRVAVRPGAAVAKKPDAPAPKKRPFGL